MKEPSHQELLHRRECIRLILRERRQLALWAHKACDTATDPDEKALLQKKLDAVTGVNAGMSLFLKILDGEEIHIATLPPSI